MPSPGFFSNIGKKKDILVSPLNNGAYNRDQMPKAWNIRNTAKIRYNNI